MPDPVAFFVFGREIRWYGILIAFAMLLGILIAVKRANYKKVISDDILDIVIISIPSAIIGARLYYVIFNWSYYSNHPGQIIAIWLGGLAIHGGLIGGFLSAYFICKYKKLNYLKILDVFAPCFPLGQAIGRWGNYFNQEAYGAETTLPWAITVTDSIKGVIKVHPTFLYESLWNVLIVGFLLYYEKKYKKYEGELISLYIITYSLGRFFIEGLRTDSLMFLGIRIAQLISVIGILFGIIIIYYLRKNNKKLKS